MWYEAVLSILIGIGFLILVIGLINEIKKANDKDIENKRIQNEFYKTIIEVYKDDKVQTSENSIEAKN